jgi:hypothetical protein
VFLFLEEIMARALWLASEKPPKEFMVKGEAATILTIKNGTLEARLLPETPEAMTVKAVMDWAELVRRVATGYGANVILLDKTLTLEPLLFTLQHTLRPYRVSLQVVE